MTLCYHVQDLLEAIAHKACPTLHSKNDGFLSKVLSRVITEETVLKIATSCLPKITHDFLKEKFMKNKQASIVAGAAGSAKFKFICTFQELESGLYTLLLSGLFPCIETSRSWCPKS